MRPFKGYIKRLTIFPVGPISVKNAYRFLLVKIDNLVFNFRWKNKRPREAKLLLKKVNKVGKLAVLDIKAFYKAILTYTMW